MSGCLGVAIQLLECFGCLIGRRFEAAGCYGLSLGCCFAVIGCSGGLLGHCYADARVFLVVNRMLLCSC